MALEEARMQNIMQYAKFIVAAIGVTATTLLGVIPESSTTWVIITAIAAVATALGVFLVKNAVPTPVVATPQVNVPPVTTGSSAAPK